MIRSVLPFICLIGLAFPAFSQDEDDEPLDDDDRNAISMEILSDHPEDMKIIRFHLPLWELTGSKMNTSIYDANAGFFAQLGNRWIFTASYSYQVGDRIAPDTYEDQDYINHPVMMSVNKNTHANHLFVSGTYFFREKVEKKNMSILVKKRGDMNYEVWVPGKELIRTGIRLGYTQGVTWYCMNNAKLRAQVTDNPSAAAQDFNLNSMTTMMEYTNLHVGISRSRLTNLLVKLDKYGKRRNSDLTIWNFDLLFSVRNKLDNVYADTGESTGNNIRSYQVYNINDYNKKLKIGASVGFRYLPPTSMISMGWEIGYFPGLTSNINAYVKAGVSFYLGKRLKAD